ncbi:response regulator transcription factor [Candidatus Symbiopectobacterium sp. NZEC135]|uniref:response regulator transcription factor n=1 Tax=Candidatus Symbiopectobacterium sp. NZEC135 TaxID=2820471 RepID=UPI0022263547|nr:response regulator [Candidatus Symbiopectobacterium sp. NZEC135]MCW2480988.1 response regulator transcription factor [Candidatus Symbiopectobacterium sp. NZEC135]
MTLCVYLIDDDDAIRDSLSALLASVGWQTQPYASVTDFEQRHSDWRSLHGCLLLDIRMPGKTGLTLLEEWQQRGMDIPVIIMTGHGNINLCRRAFKSGAFEFLTKPIDADLLLETVSGAMTQFQTQTAQRQQATALRDKLNTLSAREHEVMALMMEGKSNKEIAKDLQLSARTVEAHRANLFAKLEINSLAKLIKLYGGQSLIDKTP